MLIGISEILNLVQINLVLAWEPFRDLIPESERRCLVNAYHKRLNSNDKETQVSLNILGLLQCSIFVGCCHYQISPSSRIFCH